MDHSCHMATIIPCIIYDVITSFLLKICYVSVPISFHCYFYGFYGTLKFEKYSKKFSQISKFRHFLCNDPEESSQATCDEVHALFLKRLVFGLPSMEGRAANPSRIMSAITNTFFCNVAERISIEFSMDARLASDSM